MQDIGDSCDLSRKAKDAAGDVIVFYGVYYMAESVKMLNPNKTVLLHVLSACCPMVSLNKVGGKTID